METEVIQCPYCGEAIEIAIDLSVRKQEYIEDCQVCCQPMTLVVIVDAALTVSVDARADS